MVWNMAIFAYGMTCRPLKIRLTAVENKSVVKNWEIQMRNWGFTSGQTGGARVDKLVVHLDLLYLRLEMTVASFVIVQALSMCCRIQFCMIHGGVPAIFSVLESSEVKFPALEGFVLPTYFPSRLGNLTTSWPTGSQGLPPSLGGYLGSIR